MAIKSFLVVFSLLIVGVITQVPLAQAQLLGLGGLLGPVLGLLRIQGILYCTPNGNIGLSGTSTPAFASMSKNHKQVMYWETLTNFHSFVTKLKCFVVQMLWCNFNVEEMWCLLQLRMDRAYFLYYWILSALSCPRLSLVASWWWTRLWPRAMPLCLRWEASSRTCSSLETRSPDSWTSATWFLVGFSSMLVSTRYIQCHNYHAILIYLLYIYIYTHE